MRGALDATYTAAAYAAAVLLIGTLIMVLLSILGRLFAFHVRGTDAYADYLMAGCGFLALAHTLKRGEHIRVTLLSRLLHGESHRVLRLVAIGIGAVLAAVLAWFSARLVWQSYTLNDISSGNDATPLWLPQLAMAAGTVLFAVAIIDEFVLEWRGRQGGAQRGSEPMRME
jgi:TRAP-type C4-dicarboxylate transport system permease small subunit